MVDVLKPCRYILNEEECPYGTKCRFAHSKKREKENVAVETIEVSNVSNPEKEAQDDSSPPQEKVKQKNCYFYLHSYCKYGSRCKFNHPRRPPSKKNKYQKSTTPVVEKKDSGKGDEAPADPKQAVDPMPVASVEPVCTLPSDTTSVTPPIVPAAPKPMFTSDRQQTPLAVKTRKPNQENFRSHQPPPLTLESFLVRPAVKRPQKDSNKQKEAIKGVENLRDIELEQLQVRFPGDTCKLLEKSKDCIAYLINFEPTDQEWHGPDVLQLKVTFPESYPNQFCQIKLASNPNLAPESVEEFERAVRDYWTTDMLGTLMFRPFLRWLDKNIVDLVHLPSSSKDFGGLDGGTGESGGETSESLSDEGEEEEEFKEKVAQVKSKKGTEIRLVGLETSQNLGTAYWNAVSVVLACSRCKNHYQIELKEERLYSVSCDRCGNLYTALYHLALIHANSFTVGYLELAHCSPVEVVFQSSTLTMTCLNCSSAVTSTGFFIDQPKDEYCRRCHVKMTLSAKGIRFLQHQLAEVTAGVKGESVTTVSSRKKAEADLFKDGYPLPDYGVCQHYKKSHRWLRFPCCGRAFPCDVCHDAVQDHPMDRATRMICGYCSKEQTFTVKGECVRCGADMVSSKTTSHWEGGQGCRNKSKMSRLQNATFYCEVNKARKSNEQD